MPRARVYVVHIVEKKGVDGMSLSDAQREALRTAHAAVRLEMNWNEPGHEPNLARLVEILAGVLPVLGEFCETCSGSGETWRGMCDCQKVRQCDCCDGRGFTVYKSAAGNKCRKPCELCGGTGLASDTLP